MVGRVEVCPECGTVKVRRERAMYFLDADGNTRDRRLVVAEALKLLAAGWTGRQAARHLRVSEAMVSRIKNGDQPHHIGHVPLKYWRDGGG